MEMFYCEKMNFLLFNRKYGMMHRILQQRENIFQTRMNELGAIPSSFTRHIILDLSKFLGFHHIFFSTFALSTNYIVFNTDLFDIPCVTLTNRVVVVCLCSESIFV